MVIAYDSIYYFGLAQSTINISILFIDSFWLIQYKTGDVN